MLYLVLNEHQVTAFNFYLGHQVQQGIRHGADLYGLAYTFDPELWLPAYAFAQQLTESGCSVIVTVGKDYRVWVGLNAAEYPYYQAMKETQKHPITIAV